MSRPRRVRTRPRTVLVALVAAPAVVLGAGAGAYAAKSAGTYHVSTTGKDSGDGSVKRPWRTIAKATGTAPAGATILVGKGRYAPFTVTRPGQTIAPEPGDKVSVVGAAGVQDVIRVSASSVTLDGLTVTGCVPNSAPAGGFEANGSSDVRLDDGTTAITLRNLTISASRGTNTQGRPFGCFGVFAHGSDAFVVQDSDISGTGTGVYVNGGGRRAVVSDNDIHDNDVLIRNTPGGDDDFGANGVDLSNLTADPGVRIEDNEVTGNAGRSSDYGTDGGAFEIYNASHVAITGNTAADNDVVVETGASPNGGACVGNEFTGNQVSGRSAGSGVTQALGVLLRCATGMVVADNTFDYLDGWVYDIDDGDRFSTDVQGLQITDNVVSQSDPVYRLAVDPVAEGLDVDDNRFPVTGSVFAVYGDGSTSATLAAWQRRTGLDRHSTTQ